MEVQVHVSQQNDPYACMYIYMCICWMIIIYMVQFENDISHMYVTFSQKMSYLLYIYNVIELPCVFFESLYFPNG